MDSFSNHNKNIYSVIDKVQPDDINVERLVYKVLRKTTNKKKHGLYGDVEIVDMDAENIYLVVNDTKYTIRTWELSDEGKRSRVSWSLFKSSDTQSNTNGIELSCGVSMLNNIFTN